MTRYLTNRGDGEHPLESALPAVETPELTESQQATEDARIADAPQTGEPNQREPREPRRSVDHEADWSALNDKEVPRHDRYADENSPWPTPARVVPSTPTNANPSFADYAAPQQDRPGFADGTDAEDVAAATGEEPKDPEVTYTAPEGPVAGEGAYMVRPPTEEATGVTSPVGDLHNDPADARPADTYEEAKAVSEQREGRLAEEEVGYHEPDAPEPIPIVDGQSVVGLAVQGEDPAAATGAGGAGAPESGDEEMEMPAGNASTEAWREYAIAQGTPVEDAERMSRDELRDFYTQGE